MTSVEPNYATAFLSHASDRKSLARKVARELGRRGVVPWLDEFDLTLGDSISTSTAQAAASSAVLVVFMSPGAGTSRWVADESKVLAALSRQEARERLVLVSDGELPVVEALPLVLRNIVLHADRDVFDVVISLDLDPAVIARGIAGSVYKRLNTQTAADVNIVLDQRGSGQRTRRPPEVARLDLSRPTLVFRHNCGQRRPKELLRDEDWTRYQIDLRGALSSALPTRAGRTVHIAGNPQLALAVMMGWHFRRSNDVRLCVHGRQDGRVFNNLDQAMTMSLTGGTADCATIHPEYAPPLTAHAPDIDLILAPERCLPDITGYRQQSEDSLVPVVWIKTAVLSSNDDVMKLTANVVARLVQLGSPRIRLFTMLPMHALPILAANLDMVVKSLQVMEFDAEAGERSGNAADYYVALPLPSDVGAYSGDADHPFRAKPITRSGRWRSADRQQHHFEVPNQPHKPPPAVCNRASKRIQLPVVADAHCTKA